MGKRTDGQESRIAVRCIVSDRWISFPQETDDELQCGHPLCLRIMTRGSDDNPWKICELIVIEEELVATIT